MINKLIKLLAFIAIFYQTSAYSKSASFNDFNLRDLTNYFSGIIAFENRDNSEALKFFNASKVLLDKHDKYLKRYIYSLVLEDRVAALEGGVGALSVASGQAASAYAIQNLAKNGDNIVASSHLYGGTYNQFKNVMSDMGIDVRFVDPSDPQNFANATDDKTRAYYGEVLPNPSFEVFPISEVAEIGRPLGIPLIVDNTAAPVICKPFDHGAAVLIHSTTKFIGGHGNTMGGILIESGKIDWHRNDKYPGMSKPDQAYHGLTFAETFGDFGFTMKARMVGLRDYGSTLSPQSAWNLLQGVETLPLRMERHCSNAQAVAEWLEKHPKVSWVSYPGLKSNKFYDLANKYLPKGKGAVFTFGVEGGYNAGVKLIDCVDLHSNLANIGDTRSLILHPASTTHRQLTEEQREGAGASSDAIRLSVGIEDVDDIIADLDQALKQV